VKIRADGKSALAGSEVSGREAGIVVERNDGAVARWRSRAIARTLCRFDGPTSINDIRRENSMQDNAAHAGPNDQDEGVSKHAEQAHDATQMPHAGAAGTDAAQTVSTDAIEDTAAAAATAAATAAAALADAQAQIAALKEDFLRAKAETENARRRAQEDVAKAHKFGIESFAEQLLPVVDSLEAALADPAADPAKLREGVELTLKQLSSALEKGRVSAIQPAVGEKFDPHRHQAISMVPADQDPNTIVTVLQKGFVIAERILRPALVMVAAPK
jgi:molecular chaperone GrpE